MRPRLAHCTRGGTGEVVRLSYDDSSLPHTCRRARGLARLLVPVVTVIRSFPAKFLGEIGKGSASIEYTSVLYRFYRRPVVALRPSGVEVR